MSKKAGGGGIKTPLAKAIVTERNAEVDPLKDFLRITNPISDCTPDPIEYNATIEDFFSDENDDDEDSESDDDDFVIGGIRVDTKGKRKKYKKKKTSVGQKNPDMTTAEFRKHGKELIDFIANYIEGARDKPVNHRVPDGFLFRKTPHVPPKESVQMNAVFTELNDSILPGIPQWHSPKHHALMPAGSSYASLLGSMLCDGLGCISLTWEDCPSAIELEMVVMNWLAVLMDLPMGFHFRGSTSPGEGGGGMIQSSTTETLLTIAVAAKRTMIESLGMPNDTDPQVASRLIAYCSEQAHPSIERIAEVAGIKIKRLFADSKGIMHADTVKLVIEQDIKNGLFPFLVIGTLGTIASTSVDEISKIGPLCKQFERKIWFHIESGYAGSSFICREFQPLLHGIAYADSFSMSAHKWMPVHMDCACLWVRNASNLTFTFGCEDPEGPLTIPRETTKHNIAEYRHWSLPITRRFRAMKLWMVFKLYGTKGLQKKIRHDVQKAKEFIKILGDDHRFDFMGNIMFGIVPFRIKRPSNNEVNKDLLTEINRSVLLKMTGAYVGNKFWLRFVVSGRHTDLDDVKFSCDAIKRITNKVIIDFTERNNKEGRYGTPNYTHVNKIGINERLDIISEDFMLGSESQSTPTNVD